MALKNRLGTGTWKCENDTLDLQSNLVNLKSLSEDTGKDFYAFLESCNDPQSLTKLFYHLQVNTSYSEEEIYAAFFGDLNAYNGSMEEQLVKLLGDLTGAKENEILNASSSKEKKAEA